MHAKGSRHKLSDARARQMPSSQPCEIRLLLPHLSLKGEPAHWFSVIAKLSDNYNPFETEYFDESKGTKWGALNSGV
jgi:hypothetical protein